MLAPGRAGWNTVVREVRAAPTAAKFRLTPGRVAA
jgi:hypothetical protein